MNEEFLDFIWSHSLFSPKISTTDNQDIVVKSPGVRNDHSGPDFFNAKVSIGPTTWSGNLEIHVKSSDWLRHKHSEDKAYQKIILHVVYEHDVEIPILLDHQIPTLELKSFVKPQLLTRYREFQRKSSFIPCESRIQEVPEIALSAWKSRLMVERLERKSKEVLNDLSELNNDWDEVAYRQLAQGFGFGVNKEPFVQLTRKLPLKIIRKYLSNPIQSNALLIGCSGLLVDNGHAYTRELIREWNHLSTLHALEPLPKFIWKTSGIRPANFPALRIAQFSSILSRREGRLLQQFVRIQKIKEFEELFESKLDAYWGQHFGFEFQETNNRFVKLGRSSFELLMINTVIPLLFQHSRFLSDQRVQDLGFELMEQLKSEKNGVIRKWESVGVKASSAGDSQSLMQLYTEYCSKKKCLFCSVGKHLLK